MPGPPFPSAKGREEAIDEGAHLGRWVCSWTCPLWHSTWNVAHVTLQPPLTSFQVRSALLLFFYLHLQPVSQLPCFSCQLSGNKILPPPPTLCPSSTGLWQEALGGSSNLGFSHACPFIPLPEQSIRDLWGRTGLHLLLPPSAGMRKQLIILQTRAAPTLRLRHLFAFVYHLHSPLSLLPGLQC